MASLDEADARRLGRGCGARRKRYATFIIRRFIRYLIDAGAVRPPEPHRDDSPLARLRQEYEEYLRVQRGLSERSIYHCWRFADRFIAFRFKGKVFDWVKITAPDLARFMQSLTSRRDKTPRVAFADALILNEVLERAFRKAGVKPLRRYVGSHILRHSLATNMVRSGASLAEIGDMLRHRARSTTMIYAKLDIEGLRSIAREWPMAGGAQ